MEKKYLSILHCSPHMHLIFPSLKYEYITGLFQLILGFLLFAYETVFVAEPYSIV